MRRSEIVWMTGILMVVLLTGLTAAVPGTMTLQGKLTDSSGASQQGTFNFTFKIYDTFTGGAALYEKKTNITTDANGIYDIILDNVNLNFSDEYYLGITIGTDSESTPRVNLTSSPYSFRANVSEGLDPDNTYVVDTLSASTLNVTSNLYLLGIANLSIPGNLSVEGNFSAGQALLVDSQGNRVGIGTSDLQAYLDIAAATASQASVRIQSGVQPAAPNVGDIYTDGTDLFFYDGAAWRDLTVEGGASAGGWTDSGATVALTTASDNVGLGTSSPSEKLTVSGNASFTGNVITGGSIVYSGGQGPQSDGLGWVDDGSVIRLSTLTDIVGIGTLSPLSTLHINGTGPKGGFRVTNDSGTTSLFINSTKGTVSLPLLANCDTLDTDADGALQCGTDSSGSVSAGEALNVTYLNASKDTLLNNLNVTGTSRNATFEGDVRIKGTLYGGSPLKIAGGLNLTVGTIIFPDDTTLSSSTISADVNNTDINVTRFVANNTLFVNGSRVGIGTAHASGRLTIKDVSGYSTVLQADTIDNNGYAGLGFFVSTTEGSDPQAGIRAIRDGGFTSVDLGFHTGGDTEAMRIDSSGNVGIGNTIPNNTLDVSGDANITGTTFVNTLSFRDGTTQTTASSGSGFENNTDINVTRLFANNTLFVDQGSVAVNARDTYEALHVRELDHNMIAAFNSSNSGSSRIVVDGANPNTGIQFRQGGVNMWSISSLNGNLSFWDEDDSIERMTILGSSGNVGIGVSNPSYALQVANGSGKDVNLSGVLYVNSTDTPGQLGRTGSVDIGEVNRSSPYNSILDIGGDTVNTLRLMDTRSVGTHGPHISFENGDGKAAFVDVIFTHSSESHRNGTLEIRPPDNNGRVVIYNGSTVGAEDAVMTVFDRKVGIGNTLPNATLEVSGTGNFSGTLQASDFVGDGSALTGVTADFTNNTDINVTRFVANNTLFVNGSRVGIGTSSPGYDLHIAKLDQDGEVNLKIENTASSSNSNRVDFIMTLKDSNGDARNVFNIDAGFVDNTAGSEETFIDFYTRQDGSNIRPLSIRSGNVGIGTISPGQALHVNGSVNITQNVFYGGNLTGYGADFAEMMPASEQLSPGEVVCFTDKFEVERCVQRANPAVAGVVSQQPTIIGNGGVDGVPVAITGLVTTHVKGPVERFDLLTSSSAPGHAEKATLEDFGSIIGKALESCQEFECSIKVLVSAR